MCSRIVLSIIAVILLVSCEVNIKIPWEFADVYVMSSVLSTDWRENVLKIEKQWIDPSESGEVAFNVDSAYLSDDEGRRWNYEVTYNMDRTAVLVIDSIRAEVGRTYTVDLFIDGEYYTATQKIEPSLKVVDVTVTTVPSKEGGTSYKSVIYYEKEEGTGVHYYSFGGGNALSPSSTNFSDEGLDVGLVRVESFSGHGTSLTSSFGGMVGADHYVITVSSISKENYLYLKALDAAELSNGGLFTSIPEEIPCNFKGPRRVYGQFFAVDRYELRGSPSRVEKRD